MNRAVLEERLWMVLVFRSELVVFGWYAGGSKRTFLLEFVEFL
jgi:hypothetical protein